MKTVTIRLTRTVRQIKTLTLDVPITYDDTKSATDPVGLAKTYVIAGEAIGKEHLWMEEGVKDDLDFTPVTDGKVGGPGPVTGGGTRAP